MFELSDFFHHLDTFRYRAIFDGIEYPWEVVTRISKYIKEAFKEIARENESKITISGISAQNIRGDDGKVLEKMILVESMFKLKSPLFLKDLGIYIGKGTLLEPTAIIKSPAIIGSECEIRQGAYLRGNIIVGDNCILGHTTEIKNSVIMDHTEAGHFAYIGDSVLGCHVNLGAGTKIANLQLRTREEKDSNKINPIKITIDERVIDTGMQKFGAIVGDYAEIGCNTVTCPGALIGKNSWILPNTTVKKGYYPSPGKP